IAVKIVTEYKDNPRKYSLPVQGGSTILVNSENSENLAILESSSVTAIRTGAVSGLATRLLSRSDSETVGAIGTGHQARSMLEAVLTVRKGIDSVRVYSRNQDNVRKFVKEMSDGWKINVKAVSDSASAIKDADIVNVATNSSTPVLQWKDLQKGTHINSIGTLPDRRELDQETIANSAIFVDTKEGVLKDAGDVIAAIEAGVISKESIKADLSQLVTGTIKGRENNSEVTLFKSVGMALQDVYACNRIYEKVSTT
ncbi:MAG: ornithine cyclodeaminase family protein, partial [Nitrososphaerales archaeon]